MKNNKGFSLIEMMIVIAIAAILIGGTNSYINMLNRANTYKYAEKINSALSKVRMESMSKGDKYYYLIIRREESEKCYYMNVIAGDEELSAANWKEKAVYIGRNQEVGKGKIRISYSNNSDGTGFLELSDTPIFLSFHPSSGAFKSNIKQIVISYDHKKTSILHMVTSTGKHYIE